MSTAIMDRSFLLSSPLLAYLRGALYKMWKYDYVKVVTIQISDLRTSVPQFEHYEDTIRELNFKMTSLQGDRDQKEHEVSLSQAVLERSRQV